jgi:hypothetical protein
MKSLRRSFSGPTGSQLSHRFFFPKLPVLILNDHGFPRMSFWTGHVVHFGIAFESGRNAIKAIENPL